MELLKASLKSLTAVLRDIDRVAIIAYNQKTKVILQSISGDNKSSILESNIRTKYNLEAKINY